MDIFDLSASISLDTSQLQRSLTTASQNFQKFKTTVSNTGMEKFTSSANQAGASSETLKNKISVLQNQYQTAEKKVEELSKAFNETVKSEGASSQAAQDLAKELNAAEKDVDSLTKELDSLTDAEKESANGTDDFGGSLLGANGSLSDFLGSIGGGGGKLGAFSGKLGEVIPKIKAGGPFVVGLAAAAAAAIGLAKAIEAATKAAVDFTKDSVNVGMEFDKSMSQVAATLGTTTDSIGELRDFAMEMGSKTAFSATEAAEALNYMALAGYDSATSMKMLPNVLNLAAAGSIDLAYASDMVTDAQTALGLSVEETETLVDQMAKTASSSNTSVEQLGEAILTIGGTAKYMNGGITGLNKVLGVLADNGIKGSEAGTHLRNMLLSISAPTDDAKKMLAELGVSIFDADGKMRDFAEIFPELKQAMDGFTDEQTIEVFDTIFNTRDIATANALLSTSAERWEELGGKIEDAAGAAEEMAKTQLDNLAGDITLFDSALEGVQIRIAGGLTPVLREFVQEGGGLLSKFAEDMDNLGFDAAVDNLLLNLQEAVPRMLEMGGQWIGNLVSGIAEHLPEVAKTAGTVIRQFLDYIVAHRYEILAKGVEIIAAIIDGMASFIDGLLTPTKSATDTIVGGFDAVDWGALGTKVIKAIGHALLSINPITIAVRGITTTIKNTFTNVDWASIGKNIIDGIKRGFTNAVSGLISSVKSVGSTIKNTFTGLFKIHSPSVWADKVIGQNIVFGIAQGFKKATPAAEKSAEDMVEEVFNTITSLQDKYQQEVDSRTESIFNSFKLFDRVGEREVVSGDYLTANLRGQVATIEEFYDNINALASRGVSAELVEDIREMGVDAVDELAALLNMTDEQLNEYAELYNKKRAISNKYATESLEGLRLSTNAEIQDQLDSLGDIYKKQAPFVGNVFIDGLTKGIMDGMKTVSDAASKVAKGAITAVKDTLEIHSPSRVLENLGMLSVDGFALGWEEQFDRVIDDLNADLAFDTETVDFSTSSIGISTAGLINSIGNQSGGGAPFPTTINLMFPDGTKIASYLLKPLADYAKSNGTPILNPR